MAKNSQHVQLATSRCNHSIENLETCDLESLEQKLPLLGYACSSVHLAAPAAKCWTTLDKKKSVCESIIIQINDIYSKDTYYSFDCTFLVVIYCFWWNCYSSLITQVLVGVWQGIIIYTIIFMTSWIQGHFYPNQSIPLARLNWQMQFSTILGFRFREHTQRPPQKFNYS